MPRSRQNGKTNTYGLKVGRNENKSPCLYRLRSEKILERTLKTIDSQSSGRAGGGTNSSSRESERQKKTYRYLTKNITNNITVKEKKGKRPTGQTTVL